MSKAPRIAETIELPSFDAGKAADQFRAFAEKGVEQSKEMYGKLKSGAESAQKAMETTFETAKSTGSEMSLKLIATMRTNAETDFAHLEALVGVKSLSELVELQSAYFRKRVEMTVDQAKEMQAIASKAAEKVSEPMKSAFESAVKELKAA